MPNKSNKLSKKWNFYINEIDKLNYLKALASCGKIRAQSAGVRALIYLYTTDQIVRDKVNLIIDDFIVYKENNEVSLL